MPAVKQLKVNAQFLKVRFDYGIQYTAADVNAALQHLKLLEAEDHSEFSLSQLQEVKLQIICATGLELLFTEFLLAKSPALKIMCVQPSFAMSVGKQLKILKEMNRFRRASPNVDIIWKYCSSESYYLSDWYGKE
ncbi:conserved hypothetical protein [Ricinus communis]|uniref:FBD domain-containing protein n=1 Tax=Ricinus communis TaxID=3988 RepID=B9RLB9_RICCO|nr:conserved hypothetical protein [Ricinus communis]